jgi:4-diphosphocytidyl-2-C-methyl-D-erythritol kinase
VRSRSRTRAGGAARLVAALASGGLEAAEPCLFNALELPARSLAPEIDRLLSALADAGGFAPRLTGSGSACFALMRSSVEARRVAARLEMAGWPGVWLARPDSGRKLAGWLAGWRPGSNGF